MNPIHSTRAVVFLSLFVFPGMIKAWGFEGHKLINRRAVEQLPKEIGVYFREHTDYISGHSVDPDLWRLDAENHPEEGHGHFIDADLYDRYPFRNIPRDRKGLEEKYGIDRVKQWGTAPWRVESYFDRLVDEFTAGQWQESWLTAAALGHYVADIHMPLHTVENYNGQLSGNDGIHKRWEKDMVDLYVLGRVNPRGKLISVKDPVELAFRIVRESFRYHKRLLRADLRARKSIPPKIRGKIADRDFSLEGTPYLEILYRKSGKLAEKRMELAALRVASFWYAAWLKAGSPSPPQS